MDWITVICNTLPLEMATGTTVGITRSGIGWASLSGLACGNWGPGATGYALLDTAVWHRYLMLGHGCLPLAMIPIASGLVALILLLYMPIYLILGNPESYILYADYVIIYALLIWSPFLDFMPFIPPLTLMKILYLL